MAKLHRYVDGRGYYLKSAFEGMMVTYQITPAGENYLRKERLGEGATISVDQLLHMKREGYLMTGGSGPGVVEPTIPIVTTHSPKPRWSSPKVRSSGQPTRSARKRSGGCCCLSVLVMIVIFSTMIFSVTAWVYYLAARKDKPIC